MSTETPVSPAPQDPNPSSTPPATSSTTSPPTPAPTTTTLSPEPAPTLLTEPEKTPEPAAPQGAPEKYDPFKVPEGFRVDEPVLAEVHDIFKKLNLTQAQGQELMDFYAKQTTKVAEAPLSLYAETREGWVREVNADPTIGGRNLPAVKTAISKMIDAYLPAAGAKAFRDAVNLTGAGDNPAIIRALYSFAQKLGEGTQVRGNGPSEPSQAKPGATPKSIAQALYPNLPSANN